VAKLTSGSSGLAQACANISDDTETVMSSSVNSSAMSSLTMMPTIVYSLVVTGGAICYENKKRETFMYRLIFLLICLSFFIFDVTMRKKGFLLCLRI
jgi:hypothetical protein